MKIVSVSIDAWDLPMRAPYRSAQRVTTTAHNVLATVRLEDGSVGFGESAPARYVTGETQESVVAGAHPAVAEMAAASLEDAAAIAAQRLKSLPGARGLLETALADAGARSAGQSLCRYLGADASAPSSVTTDLSLPILPPEEAGARARAAAQDGFRALKIKVGGGDPDADEARVRAIAAAAPGASLRLDGNQGFGAEDAVRFIDRLCSDAALAARIELFEQPTPAGDIAALSWISGRIAAPVFADESACSAETAAHLIESGACAGVVLKLAKTALHDTADTARAVMSRGGRCLFGCMMESRIAIGAALHLALSLGTDGMLFDLDGHLLVEDTHAVEGGLLQRGDLLCINPAAPGLGLVAGNGRVI